MKWETSPTHDSLKKTGTEQQSQSDELGSHESDRESPITNFKPKRVDASRCVAHRQSRITNRESHSRQSRITNVTRDCDSSIITLIQRSTTSSHAAIASTFNHLHLQYDHFISCASEHRPHSQPPSSHLLLPHRQLH